LQIGPELDEELWETAERSDLRENSPPLISL
jgi:hypothetical protein